MKVSTYPIEVELNKLKKILEQEDITKDILLKQIRELKWKIFVLESYIDYKM